MSASIMILGGYGNFGQRIARALVKKSCPVIIVGRDRQKAEVFAATLPSALASVAVFDVAQELSVQLAKLKPAVVINTCGPFQLKGYDVAEACIKVGVHYVDLADGREFVTGITALDKKAKAANVWAISGASTVPGLSSAVIEHYKNEFAQIDSLLYGISPGQKADRGLATTEGILTYIGKPLKPVLGEKRYGWQDNYRQPYPVLGKRWMANCDVPDLDLFPAQYGIKHIRFSAGMENSLLHLGIWFMGWLVRLGLPLKLHRYAAPLLRISHWFDHLGSDRGGMHVILQGKDNVGQAHERRWFIVALDGDGPQIPCVPAIILAHKLATVGLAGAGAAACVGMVTLEEYLAELKTFAITIYEEDGA